MFTKMGWRKSETSHKHRVEEVITQLAVGRCRARSHAQSCRALALHAVRVDGLTASSIC